MNLFKKLIERGIFDFIDDFVYKKTNKSLNYNSDDINYTFTYLNLDQFNIIELISKLELRYEIKINDKFSSEYITVSISQLIEEIYEKLKTKNNKK